MIKKYKISDNDYKVPQKRANKFKIFHKDYKVHKNVQLVNQRMV